MTLYKGQCSEVDKITRRILHIVDAREHVWTNNQKDLLKERIKQKQMKARSVENYQNKMLCKCKTWGGPFTSVDELEIALGSNPDKVELIVKTELTYFRHSHRTDVTARPELYKTNGISNEERLENLTLLLNDSNISGPPQTVNLPTNRDALRVLTPCESSVEDTRDLPISVNELCVTLWSERGSRNWYIGYCTSVDNNVATVDHLHRSRNRNNSMWKYPSITDCVDVSLDQILEIKPIGEWDMRNSRNISFKL